ncbi:MAG TPA: NAD(P)H-hydrate dehydratase, partial [Acidimicrobiia bacterium]|nr:NAD(P)H-hydrate dehydratase [Acidimicrobiia bacterium]
RGVHVVVHALADPKTQEAARAADLARAAGIEIVSMGPPEAADLVIDAVFGGGGRSDLPPVLEGWTSTPSPVIAVDFPTGLDPDTGEAKGWVFSAVETVTFQYLKTGHVKADGPDVCGVVTVVDLGIEGGEPSMWLAGEEDAPRPSRPRRSHKWSAGSVLVIGGSTGMVGAAVFAGRSALHFGAGAVVVASPNSEVVARVAPELLTQSLADAEERLDRFDVVIAGPGLGEADHAEVLPLVGKAGQVVLDAGALTPEILDAARGGGAHVAVTPHSGEFKRIAGVGGGEYAVRALAKKKGIAVLLKGNPTIVSDGGAPVLIRTGGPELATIGTGDVLSGMIGALWARGLDIRTSLISGAYWHGIAGADLAREGTVTADCLSTHIGRYAWEERSVR